MKNKDKIVFEFSAGTAGTNELELREILLRLEPEIEQVRESIGRGYNTDYASINLPYDKESLEKVKQLCYQKKMLGINSIFVIGIGGSNLSAIAVHKAIHGDFCGESCNGKNIDTKVYFVDTVDADYIGDLLQIAENKLKCGENILLNIITKSGTTTESVANFEIFLHLLKKYRPDNYIDYIVAITDYDSNLWRYANKNNIACLVVPTLVGGRYSVFSPVGLFPLCFAGIDIEKLLSGARDMLDSCMSSLDFGNNGFGESKNLANFCKNGSCGQNEAEKEKDFALKIDFKSTCNIAAVSAAIIYLNYISGKNMHDTFIFSKYLKHFGCWYRQLVGESLGKRVDRAGKVVEVGITPIVSVGSVDLHSMVQLYLGGPRDKFTTFLMCNKGIQRGHGGRDDSDIIIPEEKEFEEFSENIHGKSLRFVMNALASGTQQAYKQDGRPYVSIYLPEINEYYLGQLLQMKMLEVIYLAYLLNINPFDQPQVELYKKEVRKIII